MRILHKQIISKTQDTVSDTYLNNVEALLEQIDFPSDEMEELNHFLTKYPGKFSSCKYQQLGPHIEIQNTQSICLSIPQLYFCCDSS